MTAVNLDISSSFVRTSAKAIIIRDGCVLAIRHDSEDGDWFTLPGGGQQPGEPLTLALQRECLEELGVPVQVRALCYVRDYISANHEFNAEDPDAHQVERMFEFTLLGDLGAAQPEIPDADHFSLAWLSLADLQAIPGPASRLLSRERG